MSKFHPHAAIVQELQAFEATLPVLGEFSDVADVSAYRPLPPGWLVGAADVVASGAAIAAGRYKAINMVGASVIAAVRNALESGQVPFVFGGDGAAFVVPPVARDTAAEALGAVRRWAEEEMGLSLRAALVPVEEIRAQGRDVRVARFQVSPSVAYAMFAGDGIAWVDAQMKAGSFAVEAAAAGVRPNLTGLSCRWQPIHSRRGRIASLIAVRGMAADERQFRQLVREIVALVDSREADGGRPVSEDGARLGFGFAGLDLEARTRRFSVPRWLRMVSLVPFHAMAWAIFRFGLTVGSFDPKRYRAETAQNSDFRKFDDGLMLTLDCSPETLETLERVLEGARRDAVAEYGLHVQDAALLTCIVPSPHVSDHVHFVDGAGGGYAKAAEMLKARRAAERRDSNQARE